MMGLSFSEDFFVGYDLRPSETPTSIAQAVNSLSLELRTEIAREVFGAEDPEAYAECETFTYDVIEKVKETDLCDDYDVPVTVYIDPDQFYSLTIYDN